MMEKYLTIPVSWFKLDLTNSELFILSEIVNLTSYYGKCTRNNRHFGEILEMQTQNVSRCIKSLENKGYLTSEIIPGGRNYDREITLIKMITPPNQNDNDPLSKRLETKEINNIINNIVVFLNGLVETKYKATDKTKALIRGRLNEGFTLDDFKYVIKVKSAEWKNDDKMRKYLRPETLFGTKFEGYLNQQEGKQEQVGGVTW